MILAVFIGGSVGTKTLDDVDDNGIGESGRADTAVSQNFPDKVSESVMVQNKNGSARDLEFKAVVADVEAALGKDKGVRNISSPHGEGNEGQLADGHSALITFELPDKDGQAEDLVVASLATVKLDRSTPATASKSSVARAPTGRCRRLSRMTSSGRRSRPCRSR